jgi:hypothetical protein
VRKGPELGGEGVIKRDGLAADDGGKVKTFVCINFALGHVAMLGTIFVFGREGL